MKEFFDDLLKKKIARILEEIFGSITVRIIGTASEGMFERILGGSVEKCWRIL